MRNVVLASLIAITALGGCKKKEPEPAAADEKKGPELLVKMPDSPHSEPFARAVTKTTVNSWSPTGSTDFQINDAHFRASGQYVGTGTVVAASERTTCTENGTWEVTSVESDTKGILTLTLTTSNCPSRDAGTTNRFEFELTGDTYRISAR